MPSGRTSSHENLVFHQATFRSERSTLHAGIGVQRCGGVRVRTPLFRIWTIDISALFHEANRLLETEGVTKPGCIGVVGFPELRQIDVSGGTILVAQTALDDVH